ncbi:MAG: co-chaperone GroES [Bdellovibrionales bacterium]|nr:co-chaperone GroES [Bdellovibrionales bacterium]
MNDKDNPKGRDDTAAGEFVPARKSVIRRIDPLGMRVVVKIRRDTNRTETGLYLPEGAKQSKQESLVGEVLEVASARDMDTDEEANISGIPNGSLVLIPADAGVRVPWDEDLRIVDTKEVLALVTEVSLS